MIASTAPLFKLATAGLLLSDGSALHSPVQAADKRSAADQVANRPCVPCPTV